MSTKRKWRTHWSYGYCGTDTDEIIDLIDDWDWSEEQLEEASDEEIEQEMDEYARDEAMQQVEYFAHEASDEDIKNYI
jgi:hypothetical protein